MDYHLAFFKALLGPMTFPPRDEELRDLANANASAARSIPPADKGVAWLRPLPEETFYDDERWEEVG
jgi:hypothetical protein